MARGIPICEEIRKLIIEKYCSNNSLGQIANELHLSRSTIQGIIKIYETTGTFLPKEQQHGRKTAITNRDLRALRNTIKQNRRSSVRNLAVKWSDNIGRTVGREWTRVQLHKLGYKFYKVWF